MGSVIYVCYKRPRDITSAQYDMNNRRILEYSKEHLFKSKYNEDYITRRLREIGDSVNGVNFNYRNRAAHTNQIKQVDAERCFDYVILVERILVNMLKEFNM